MIRNILFGASASDISIVGYKKVFYNTEVNTCNITLDSLTGGIASSPSEGDIILVLVGSGGATSDITLSFNTSGYTKVADLRSDDGFDTNLFFGYKVMGSTVDSDVEFTSGALLPFGTKTVAFILVLRGADKLSPMDVTPTVSTVQNTCKPNPPSITPINSGSLIVVFGAGAIGSFTTTISSSDLTTLMTNTGTYVIGLVGIKEWTGGSFDPAQFTVGDDSTSYSSASITIAIRPS